MKRRAMTLLELVIALTMLVTVTTLVAALWSQMRRWTDDTMRLDGALRPQRAAAFVRTQWNERRTIAPLGPGSRASAQLVGDSLEFTTASTALFPGWPLVKARYVIERGVSPTGLVADAPSTLVYEESRIVQLDKLSGLVSGAVDANGDELTRRTVLIDGAIGLRWEVLRPPREGEPAQPAWREVTEATPVALEEAAATAEKAEEPKPAVGEGRPKPETREPGESLRERRGSSSQQEQPSPPRAVRLVGRIDGKEIAWSLVVAGSR